MSLHRFEHIVSFGDCDPAGIVYYPNYYSWIDATFHGFLRARSPGHATLCRELGGRGIGLMESGLKFRAPAGEGDRLAISLDAIDWAARSFRVRYIARVGERLILDGFETRGLFVDSDERLRAAPVAPLQAWLGDRREPG